MPSGSLGSYKQLTVNPRTSLGAIQTLCTRSVLAQLRTVKSFMTQLKECVLLAEDDSKFGAAIIFTALPESIVILGLLPLFI